MCSEGRHDANEGGVECAEIPGVFFYGYRVGEPCSSEGCEHAMYAESVDAHGERNNESEHGCDDPELLKSVDRSDWFAGATHSIGDRSPMRVKGPSPLSRC